MSRSLLLLTFIMLTAGMNLSAQIDSVLSFSLKEAQDYAIENYYLSVNAEKDIESAEKRMWEYTSVGLPQVSAGIDYTYIPEVPEAVFGGDMFLYSNMEPDETVTGADLNDPDRAGIGFEPGEPIKLGVENDVSYNLLVTQLIFSGEYIVGLKATKTYKQFSEEAYEKTTITLKELVASTYFTILILERNALLLNETVENLSKIYDETKKASEVGLVESTEADQIGINVTRTLNQLKSIERQTELMYKVIKYQLGLEIDNEIQLTESIEDLIEANLVELSGYYDFNLDANIDYRLLSTQEKLNQLSMMREKSRYMPQVSAFYQYTDRLEKADFDFTMKHMVGVGVDIPIFNSGMKNAKVSQARIELEKVQLQKEQESQALIMTAEQTKYDYMSAFETYENERKNFDLSKKILDNTTAKYQEGMVSSMDLTLANNQYLEAQLTLSTAVLSLLNAKVALDKAYSKL
ncbi:MAG: TolC family protein [Bacteroidales bacterium]|nr:TolC family protein [Bacteroidales bacterium]